MAGKPLSAGLPGFSTMYMNCYLGGEFSTGRMLISVYGLLPEFCGRGFFLVLSRRGIFPGLKSGNSSFFFLKPAHEIKSLFRSLSIDFFF